MAKQAIQLTFTFDNPNSAAEFERHLQKILIDKLLCSYHNHSLTDHGATKQ